MDIEAMIARINELAKRKRTVGLTPDEQQEQQELYRLYLANIRSQLKAQLDSIEIAGEKPGPLN